MFSKVQNIVTNYSVRMYIKYYIQDEWITYRMAKIQSGLQLGPGYSSIAIAYKYG